MLAAGTSGLMDMMLGTAAMLPIGARSRRTSYDRFLYATGLMESVDAEPMPMV
jgi:hypothetical protein